PAAELPFAGHPVIGTTFALAYVGTVRQGEESPIHLELGVGTLPVDVLFEGQRLSFVWMHQPVPSYTSWTVDTADLAPALALAREGFAADRPLAGGSPGVPFFSTPRRSVASLHRARHGPDLAALLRPLGAHTGAYLFSLERLANAQGEAHSRMFAPGMGIV